MRKALFIAAAAILALALPAAAADPKGLSIAVTDDATGVRCTHWRIERETREHRAGHVQVTMGGYLNAEARDGGKQPVCARTFTLSDFGGKKVGDLTQADILPLLKSARPMGAIGPTIDKDGKPVPPPEPMFKGATID